MEPELVEAVDGARWRAMVIAAIRQGAPLISAAASYVLWLFRVLNVKGCGRDEITDNGFGSDDAFPAEETT